MFLFERLKVKEFGTTLENCKTSGIKKKTSFYWTYYKFKSSQGSKAKLQSSKHTGAKPNLRQNGDSRSFKVTCFGVSGKAIR